MIPERIPNPRSEEISDVVVCELANDWGIHPSLAFKLVNAQGSLPFDLWIFSGARTPETQSRVSETPYELSTHAGTYANGCPRLATGADVQPVSPGVRLSNAAVAQMGAAFVHQGLRWGGGAPVGDDGIPVGNERWHVDLGPRDAMPP